MVVDDDWKDQKYSPNLLDSQTFVDLVLDLVMAANNPKMNQNAQCLSDDKNAVKYINFV